jgi:hypothetical protein
MAISKQAFYEGAALHLVVRSGEMTNIRYDDPFYCLNKGLLVLVKYTTKGRSPWGFTFTADEQRLLKRKSAKPEGIVIGLVCGDDGVAAVTYEQYVTIASSRQTAIHVACFRRHDEHYEIRGPDGTLPGKVPPSAWRNLLRA